MMGSPETDQDARDNERPQHKVTITKPFAVSRFEVTFAQWNACIDAGGCENRPSDAGWGQGARPVMNVSWDDITKQYLPWLNRVTGQAYRLLTEAEWEYAARAGKTTRYSWGKNLGENNANCYGCKSQWDNEQTAPVGSFVYFWMVVDVVADADDLSGRIAAESANDQRTPRQARSHSYWRRRRSCRSILLRPDTNRLLQRLKVALEAKCQFGRNGSPGLTAWNAFATKA